MKVTEKNVKLNHFHHHQPVSEIVVEMKNYWGFVFQYVRSSTHKKWNEIYDIYESYIFVNERWIMLSFSESL